MTTPWRRALRIIHDSPGIGFQEFLAAMRPGSRGRGLNLVGGDLLRRLSGMGLIRRHYVGRFSHFILTHEGREALPTLRNMQFTEIRVTVRCEYESMAFLDEQNRLRRLLETHGFHVVDCE